MKGDEVMKKFSQENLDQLLAHNEGPCVSIYFDLKPPFLSPKNVSRLRRLLREAEVELLARFGKAHTFRLISQFKMFAHLQSELRNAKTVCLFSSPQVAGFFPVNDELPRRVVVANSFHIKPLLPYMNPTEAWLCVHVTDKSVEFFKGQGPLLGSVSKRVRIAGFGFKKDAKAVSALIEGWVETHRTKKFTPAFVAGRQDILDKLDVSPSCKTIECPTESAEFRECVVSAAHAYLDGKARHAVVEMASCDELVVSDLDVIVKNLESNSVVSIAIKRDKTSWGHVDWSRGVVKFSEGGLLTDCVLDDIAEEALKRKVHLTVCDDSDFPEGVDVMAVLKTETVSDEHSTATTHERSSASGKFPIGTLKAVFN